LFHTKLQAPVFNGTSVPTKKLCIAATLILLIGSKKVSTWIISNGRLYMLNFTKISDCPFYSCP
jgi:hypothetical protein